MLSSCQLSIATVMATTALAVPNPAGEMKRATFHKIGVAYNDASVIDHHRGQLGLRLELLARWNRSQWRRILPDVVGKQDVRWLAECRSDGHFGWQ
jgi:hypothetical protein